MSAEENDDTETSEKERLSRSLINFKFKERGGEEEVGSETCSTSSSSCSSVDRKTASIAVSSSRRNNQQCHEVDDFSDINSEEAGEARGLLSNIDHPERHDRIAGLSSSEVAKKREKRRRLVAGVAGGVAGLAMIGPCTAVAAGVAGAMLIKRFDRKKQQQAETRTVGVDNELASLISPRPQV